MDVPRAWIFFIDGMNIMVEEGYVTIDDSIIPLTSQESQFMQLLLRRPGKIVTNLMFFNHFYSDKRYFAEAKIVDVICSKLRGRFRKVHPDAGDIIRSVWGRGHVFGKAYDSRIPSPHDELPGIDVRWTPSRKKKAVELLGKGEVTIESLTAYYTELTQEELMEWRTLLLSHGERALRITRAREYLRT